MTWERIEDVRSAVTLVVVNRPGSDLVEPGSADPLADWVAASIEIPDIEISSTDLRARAVDGRPLDFLIPDAAVRVIRERGLYAVVE